MRVKYHILAFLLCIGSVKAQLNVELLSNLDYEPILNDIWGYVDEEGTEYALVGMTTGVSIVSLEDPTDPREVQFIGGTMSTWRDLKTWGDFVYVTADQGQDGLLIIDLSSLPGDTATYAFWRPDVIGVGTFYRAHNIWIDEFGLAYLAGANIGGTVILDVKQDPWNPEILADMPLDYAHDVYARDSIVYTSEIYIGQLRMYDITDLDTIRLLGFTTTPFAFTHNAWPSDNSNYVFTTDERSNAFIGSYDVTDPANIKELDRFRPSETVGLNVIPHNVHVYNDFLVISYYTDGCVIVDASRPDNLIEVGNYDTYPGEHGGYNGAWGAYPFLPSENILISDRQHGLFVLGPDYVRACFLEGDVADAQTQAPVQNAEVQILLEPGDTTEVLLPVMTGVQGVFRTGKAVPGTYRVRVTHPDYYPYEAEHEFINGEVLELHIELQRKAQFTVSGRVVEGTTETVVPFANVAIQSEFHLYQTQADMMGQFVIPDAFEGEYMIYAGNWGQFGIVEIDLSEDVTQDIPVANGYYDDFLFDYNWTVTNESSPPGGGVGSPWVRGIPVSELLFGTYQCNPDMDVPTDFGAYAWMTGNAGGNAANDGVRDGITILNSPVMDLSSYGSAVLTYESWICQRFPQTESFHVLVSNGVDTTEIAVIGSNEIGGMWMPSQTIVLEDHIAITPQMQIHFMAEEQEGVDNVLKAALDAFQVTDANPSATDDQASLRPLTIYPNPSGGKFQIILDGPEGVSMNDMAVTVYSVYGIQVGEWRINTAEMIVDLGRSVAAGLYLVRVEDEGRPVAVGRVVVE